MKQFEIYWDDLTEEGKERLAPLHHGNHDAVALAIVDLEDEVVEDPEYIGSGGY